MTLAIYGSGLVGMEILHASDTQGGVRLEYWNVQKLPSISVPGTPSQVRIYI